MDSLIVELYMQDKFKNDQQARSEFEQEIIMQIKGSKNKKSHN